MSKWEYLAKRQLSKINKTKNSNTILEVENLTLSHYKIASDKKSLILVDKCLYPNYKEFFIDLKQCAKFFI